LSSIIVKGSAGRSYDPNVIPGEIRCNSSDPGSWILAAAGVGYGVKKWRDSQRNGKKDIYRISDIYLRTRVTTNIEYPIVNYIKSTA
jgi:hypothetical protein